jgi:Protein of unknown function (DUF3455)
MDSMKALATSLSIVAAAVAVAVASQALAGLSEPEGLTPALHVEPGERLAFVLRAHGAQVYMCVASPGPRRAHEWRFVAPDATLLDNGRIVGYHGAGPVWESVADGSSVRAQVRESQDAGTGNVPWLLLSATSSDGRGIFSKVSSIQRVATRGGMPPPWPCDASRAGQEARVKYTADYYFYRRAWVAHAGSAIIEL